MVAKKYRRVCGKLWRPIPGSPALYGKVGTDLSNPKNRKSDLELDGLRDKEKRKVRPKKDGFGLFKTGITNAYTKFYG